LHTPITCDDSNPCTADSCSQGNCFHEPITTCPGGNACTDNTCQPGLGCTHPSISSTCLTGNKCRNEGCDNTTGCFSTVVSCDDHSLCTNDACDPATGCSHTNVSCDDQNACTQDTCTPASGCSNAPITCNSNDPCIVDSCDKVLGCVQTKLPCFYCKNVVCPSGDACDSWSCFNGTCVEQKVSCDDGNPCTFDQCHAVGNASYCNHTLNTCNNSDLCNPQTCDTTNGKCVSSKVVCDSGNLCTIGQCNPANGQCQYNPVSCPTTDPCNPNSCDQKTGNCSTHKYLCDDNNLCTSDTCAVVGGQASCQFSLNPCSSDKCHTTSCDAKVGKCVVTANPPCDDNNKCTVDTCDPFSGCKFSPLNCDDKNACTVDTCVNSLGGCQHTLLSCDDKNACTNDTCDTKLGCIHTPVTVPLGNRCLGVYCDPGQGIVTQVTECPTACGGCDPKVGCLDCPGQNTITVGAAAGIGAGAIVGITLGAVGVAALVTVGGKKGYDRLMQSRTAVTAVEDNPLYTPAQTEKINPLFESASDSNLK